MGIGTKSGIDVELLVRDFIEVSKLAGIPMLAQDIEIQVLPAPHRRTGLPLGKAAAYVFMHGDTCLKVGKVGANSDARFRSQHYLPSAAISNLAKSLCLDHVAEPSKSRFFHADRCGGFNPSAVADWMLANLSRIHFFLDAEAPTGALRLLEVFLQCRLQPLFEEGY
jgi:hypothetical protein